MDIGLVLISLVLAGIAILFVRAWPIIRAEYRANKEWAAKNRGEQ